jgi:hypothetical protein
MKEMHMGLDEIQNIDYINEKNDGPGSICLLKYKLPSFKSREFLVCFSIKKMKHQQHDTLMLIAKNCIHPISKISKNAVLGKMNSCLIIESKGTNLCRVSFTSYIDMGPGISSSIYNKVLEKRKLHFIPKLNEVVLQRKSNNLKRPMNHSKILDTYDEILMNEKLLNQPVAVEEPKLKFDELRSPKPTRIFEEVVELEDL